MAYIGTSPSNGVRRRFVYVATANQTSFSGNDENGISLVYVDVAYLDVYQNGVKLKAVDDYASTTGTTVVLVQGASADDVVEIIAFDVFSIGDTVSAKDGGSFGGNIGMGGTLAVTGAVTANAGVVVDEMTLDGDTLTATDTFTIDAVEDITLDAASTLVRIKHNGTQRFIFNTDATPEIDALGGNFTLHANTSDADIIFTGNDGGAAITALTLDMSAGGLAIFNAGLAIGGTGAANTLDDYEKGTWTPTVTGSSSGSYALDSGHKSTYIKVGNICHVSTSIGLGSLTGTASGFAVIGGFPFNYNGGVSQSTGAVIFSQANLASTHEQTHIMQSSSGTANTFFLPFMRDNDSTGETDLSIFSSSTAITFSFSYQTV